MLVDRVLECEHGKYAVGYKCITVNDNFFPGHFPQRAIMPGGASMPAPACSHAERARASEHVRHQGAYPTPPA